MYEPVDHAVIAFYVTNQPGSYSFVKFGSYDPAAIMHGEELVMMKTKNMGTWAVDLHSAKIFDYDFEFEND